MTSIESGIIYVVFMLTLYYVFCVCIYVLYFQTMLSQTRTAQKGLPPLKMSAKKFLFGEEQTVVELRDAFALAIKQQEGTVTHLEDYLNRLTSWEKYFHLLKDALAWFNPFEQVAERDIQKFKKEGLQRNSSRTKLKVGCVQ